MKNNYIIIADYSNPQHATDIVDLLNLYACHPMGGEEALNQNTKEDLISQLQNISGAFSILVYQNQQAIGLANCFTGFSTFQCRPLINVHDLYVKEEFQGQKISQAMLDKIEDIAINKNCCKITLEVLQGNSNARKAYQNFGFFSYELKPEFGQALFLEKKLT